MATVYVKNQRQLTDAILERYAASALKKTQQEIYDAIQESIYEYYREYTPEFYDRKFKFMNSLIKTDIIRKGNSLSCEVKIDESYLHYSYPNNGGSQVTGLEVAQWANRDVSGYGNHGGTVDIGRDDGFFDIGLQDLGGKAGIMALLKNNLIKRGLNVK